MWECYYCTWEIFYEERTVEEKERKHTGGMVYRIPILFS